jgi:hypothetical protein
VETPEQAPPPSWKVASGAYTDEAFASRTDSEVDATIGKKSSDVRKIDSR